MKNHITIDILATLHKIDCWYANKHKNSLHVDPAIFCGHGQAFPNS